MIITAQWSLLSQPASAQAATTPHHLWNSQLSVELLRTSLDISQTQLSYSFVMETDCKLYPYLLAEVFMQIAVYYGLYVWTWYIIHGFSRFRTRNVICKLWKESRTENSTLRLNLVHLWLNTGFKVFIVSKVRVCVNTLVNVFHLSNFNINLISCYVSAQFWCHTVIEIMAGMVKVR